MVRTKLIFHQKNPVIFAYWFNVTFFSYVRVIQTHPPTPVRNSKYLAIPPTQPFTLT